ALAVMVSGAASRAAAPAGLEGRWRLVEQRHGEGRAGLLSDSPPLWLEFVREGPRLTGRIRLESASPIVYDWPALGSCHGDDAGPACDGAHALRPLRIVRLSIDETAGRAQARYTTPASAGATDTATGDETVLDVTEDYAVAEDGRTLEGTVTIALVE